MKKTLSLLLLVTLPAIGQPKIFNSPDGLYEARFPATPRDTFGTEACRIGMAHFSISDEKLNPGAKTELLLKVFKNTYPNAHEVVCGAYKGLEGTGALPDKSGFRREQIFFAHDREFSVSVTDDTHKVEPPGSAAFFRSFHIK